MTEEFKPNIYPIMYWGLMYGLIAGFVLFIMFMLSRYLTMVWFPVFIIGVAVGGYRNYKKQKGEAGQRGEPKRMIEEFKEAARDIMGATKEMVTEQLQEAAEEEAAKQGAEVLTEDEQIVEARNIILEEGNEEVTETLSDEQPAGEFVDEQPISVEEPAVQPEAEVEPERPILEELSEAPPATNPQAPQESEGQEDPERPKPPAPPVSG